MPIPASLRPQVKFIERHDVLDLASRLGAIQLIPANFHFMMRIEFAAGLIAGVPIVAGRPKAAPTRFERWLNGDEIADSFIRTQEDEQADLFTDQISFFGGSYLVFPGYLEHAGEITQRILEGMFRGFFRMGSSPFTQKCHDAANAMLRVSNALGNRAGLSRYCLPPPRNGNDVVVPRTIELQTLAEAVRFSGADLLQIGVDPAALSPFIGDALEIDLSACLSLRFPALTRPIISHGDEFVILAPWNLLLSLKHYLLSEAIAHGKSDELLNCVTHQTLVSLVRSLEVLGLTATGMTPPKSEQAWIRDDLWSFDSDKVLHSLLMVDNLDGFDSSDPFGTWNIANLSEIIERRCLAVDEYLLSSPNPPNDVVHLISIQSLGRAYLFGYDPDDNVGYPSRLSLSPRDLEGVAHKCSGNPLALWQYDHARDALSRTTRVLTFDELGTFALYLKHGHSFYVSDEAQYDGMNIDYTIGQELYADTRCRDDVHCVRHYAGHGYSEVVRIDSNVPVYVPLPRADIQRDIAFHVEDVCVPVWVRSESSENRGAAYSDVAFRLGEMVAYWVWQLTPYIDTLLNPIAEELGQLYLEVSVPDPDEFDTPDECNESAESETGDSLLSVRGRPDGGLLLTFWKAFGIASMTANNAAEREFVSALLKAIGDLAPVQLSVTLHRMTPQSIAEIVDLVAPLGKKKKFITYDIRRNPKLIKHGLPRFRKVQSYNIQRLYDDIGAFVRNDLKFATGPISDSERTRLLTEIVSWLFGRLKCLVASLSPAMLLESLVRLNERCIYNDAHAQLTIPTRIACYGSIDQMLTRMEDEYPEITNASVASRFLLEYVTACPSKGIRPFSLSVYDEMMALSHLIQVYGHKSDAVYYSLADAHFAVLESGRLGVNRGDFDDAKAEFMSEFLYGYVGKSIDEFGRHWDAPKSEKIEESTAVVSEDDIDAAAIDEFGFGLSELHNFLLEVWTYGQTFDENVCVAKKTDFLKAINAGLDWPEAKIEAAFEYFSLRGRGDYWQQVPATEKQDLYPWRHGRRISYFRRPLLVRNIAENNEEVICGHRNVVLALDSIGSSVLGGRYKARSKRLRQLQSKVREHGSRKFNDQVADLFKSCNEFVVRRRVKKFGRRHIARANGDDLGDVDVFVAVPAARAVFAIEVKDMSVRFVPHEIRAEIVELFGEPGKSEGKLAIHEERVNWIRDNLSHVLQSLGLIGGDSEAGKWEVSALVIVDRELMSPFMKGYAKMVRSFRRMQEDIENGWPARNAT